VTISAICGDQERTLTGEEIEGCRLKLVAWLEEGGFGMG